PATAPHCAIVIGRYHAFGLGGMASMAIAPLTKDMRREWLGPERVISGQRFEPFLRGQKTLFSGLRGPCGKHWRAKVFRPICISRKDAKKTIAIGFDLPQMSFRRSHVPLALEGYVTTASPFSLVGPFV